MAMAAPSRILLPLWKTENGSSQIPTMDGTMDGMIGLHRTMPVNGAMTTGTMSGGKTMLPRTFRLYLMSQTLLLHHLVMILLFAKHNRPSGWPRTLPWRPLELGLRLTGQPSSYARIEALVALRPQAAVNQSDVSSVVAIICLVTALIDAIPPSTAASSMARANSGTTGWRRTTSTTTTLARARANRRRRARKASG